MKLNVKVSATEEEAARTAAKIAEDRRTYEELTEHLICSFCLRRISWESTYGADGERLPDDKPRILVSRDGSSRHAVCEAAREQAERLREEIDDRRREIVELRREVAALMRSTTLREKIDEARARGRAAWRALRGRS